MYLYKWLVHVTPTAPLCLAIQHQASRQVNQFRVFLLANLLPFLKSIYRDWSRIRACILCIVLLAFNRRQV